MELMELRVSAVMNRRDRGTSICVPIIFADNMKIPKDKKTVVEWVWDGQALRLEYKGPEKVKK